MQEPIVSQYRIVRKLGAGGMGEVYLAEDLRLDREVAIKVLSEQVAEDAPLRRRFMAEAKAASALNHPHVCVIYDIGECDDGRPFIAMEYVQGRSLDMEVRGAPVELDRLLDWSVQIADALDTAHEQRIVHRDIKPANICLDNRGQIKILDFGLAKRMPLLDAGASAETEYRHTQFGEVLGTPDYMSPEQALGRPIDHRSDLFSLGVVIYQMATAQLPFHGRTLAETLTRIVRDQPSSMRQFNPRVPTQLESIVAKCLHKDPEQRFGSARELLRELEKLRAGQVSAEDGPGQVGAATTEARSPEGAGGVEFASRPRTPHQFAGVPSHSDIVISCAEIDDVPISLGKRGWISQFQRNLKVRLEQLFGDHLTVFSQPMPPGKLESLDTVAELVSQATTMVSVVSPPFTKSEACCRGVEEFWQRARQPGNLWIDDQPRLFKVVKTPFDWRDLPVGVRELLEQLIGFEFYERDRESGKLREFDETFGEAALQRYHEKIYDLAVEIVAVLKRVRRGTDDQHAPDGRKCIYLAETTSDVQAERDRMRRELSEQGHVVLPDRPLPLVSTELVAAVQAYLEQSDLAIHMIGERYGIVPEDADVSLIALQNRLAAQQSANAGLPRVIWMPKGVQARDDRQVRFIREIVEDPSAQSGADVVEDTLENLKEIVHAHLVERKDEQVPPGDEEARDVPRLYLLCDPKDEAAIEPLEDFFYEQKIEVSVPEFADDESNVAKVHLRNLQDCDAVLIFYGAAPRSWVDIKLRELVKAAGYRDGCSIALQAVYVVPPFDRRKERFRTLSAEIIRQESDAFEPDALRSFASRLVELGRSK